MNAITDARAAYHPRPAYHPQASTLARMLRARLIPPRGDATSSCTATCVGALAIGKYLETKGADE